MTTKDEQELGEEELSLRKHLTEADLVKQGSQPEGNRKVKNSVKKVINSLK